MSNLAQLLQGVEVEWKALWEVTTWDKRFNAVDNYKQPKIIKYNYLLSNEIKPLILEKGNVKLLTTNETDFWTSEELAGELISNAEVVAIPWGGNVIVQYYNGKFLTSDNRIAVSNDKNYLDTKYLFYYLKNNILLLSSFYRGSGIKHPNMSNVLDLRIPIPSLPVQAEIVQILDKFSTLTAELQAELQARKSQYDYYRNWLLDYPMEEFDQPSLRSSQSTTSIKKNDHQKQPQSAPNSHTNNSVLPPRGKVEWKTLGEITSLITKGTTPKNYTDTGIAFIKTEAFDGTYINSNKLSFIDEETHNKELKRSILNHNDILITIAGATIGKCAIVPKEILPANTNQALAIIRLNADVNLKYVFHLIKSNYLKKYIEQNIKGSAQPNLNLEQLNNFIIPYPSPEEQARIVSILDKFDMLTNSITEGLPKEIELRQKQYEYYRDMLLTFPKSEL